ncbi:MAG: hypothetical protein ACJ8HI_14525 [Massilia sp.]
MNLPRLLPAHPLRSPARSTSTSMAMLLVTALMPLAALADPPATEASCDGIKLAYNTLGAQCQSAYAKINHAPATAADRLTTFTARKSVLQIFQQAMLCNGMFGATSQQQQRFRTGEDGHLTALDNLHTAMLAAGDPNVPAAFTAAELKEVTIKKQQCTR